MQTGIYEQLITTVIAKQLRDLPDGAFHVHKTPLDKQEAARYLSQYLAGTIHYALSEVHNDHRPQGQIELVNKIITLLMEELNGADLSGNLVETEEQLLEAVFSRLDAPWADLGARIREITPYTRERSCGFTGAEASGSALKPLLAARLKQLHWIARRIVKNDL